MVMSDERVKVLYIGGYSRSGSTLLLRSLGQLHGFVAIGEVWDIWRRSFSDNQLCGCGQPFRECPFWQAVVAHAFGGFSEVDVEAIQRLRNEVQSKQHLPLLAIPALRPARYRAKVAEYVDILGRLYQAIHHVSGSKVIIDSSKVPPYAYLLNQVRNLDLQIVHLVRDSRATAYSWQRKKVRPEIHWKTAYMDQYSPVRSALEWNVMNGLLQSLKFGGARYVRIRYEELVTRPYESVLRILTSMGEEMPEIDFFEKGHVVRLDVNHTVSGNPNRFQQGSVKIRPDVEWQEKMARSQKVLVTALTWPLLLNYGYTARNAIEAPPEAAPPDLAGQATDAARQPHGAQRLRLLLVTARYLPYIGGTEIHTYEVARRLAAYGHEVTVMTTSPDQQAVASEHVDGLQVIRVPAWPRRNDYYFAPALYRMIAQGGWDVIHLQGYHTLVAPITMLAAQQAQIPYVVTFHSGGHSSTMRNALRPVQQALLRPMLARAAQLISVSKWEADFFRKRLRLPRGQFAVIPNGSYLPVTEHAAAANGKHDPLIISVGRLERYKGHQRVIRALPQVMRHCPNIRLRIVGSGPYESALRTLALELEVADRVEIKGVSGSDREGMANVLMDASLVILLSDYESQGISIMEAIALGRPVLVADSTALGELVASGQARATRLGSQPDEIATVILDQLRRPLIPQQAGLPTWDTCAGSLLALYQNVVREPKQCVS
jgi:glycosyltransferase involved in cell wall biosynthesis